MPTRRSLINLAAGLMIVLAVVGCASRTALTPEQQVYVGKWVSSRGAFVQIYADGRGDLRVSPTKITNGSTTIEDDKLRIGLGPITKEFKITQPPQEQNGAFTIGLDSVTYIKQ